MIVKPNSANNLSNIGGNMKKISRITSILLLLFVLMSLLTSCLWISPGNLTGNASDNNDYATKEEVRDLVEGIEENVTVNGGDNYNVEINSNGNQNLLAASKGLLSAVSVHCKFKVTTVSTPMFGQSTSKTETIPTAGSGVIYQLDKNTGSAYIITNYHVVYYKGANTDNDISDDITVHLYGLEDEKYAINAEYIGGSMNYDIAVLEVKNSDVLRTSNAMAAEFADSNDVAILDTAIAIGNPEDFGLSATVGAVNVESENIVMTSVDGSAYISLRVIRTDAAVNGGNSGGGLFNDKGQIIGIVNAKMSDSSIDNIGYAIPSNVAKYVADNIIFYDKQDSKNDCVYRALIGITVGVEAAGTNYDIETGKITRYEKVRVEEVSAGGLSEGKLSVGDIIKSVSVDGVTYEVQRTFNVVDIMLTARKTSKVVINIERAGEAIAVEYDMSKASLSAW